MELSPGVQRNSLSLSSMEAEYVALTHVSKDVLWIQKLISELHSFIEFGPPMDFIATTRVPSASRKSQHSMDIQNT